MDHHADLEPVEAIEEEQPKASEGTYTPKGAANDQALTGAVAAMASAMANLMGPTEAAALNEAAAVLMEGGNDGDA